ncbi:MAG: DUF1989 domain-containing protein, partial [Pseudomonadota bacterium]
MLNVQAQPYLDRARYNGLKQAAPLRIDILYGEAKSVRAKAGSVVSVANVDGNGCVWISALTDQKPEFTIEAFGITAESGTSINSLAFDSRKMQSLASNRGCRLEDGRCVEVFGAEAAPGETYVANLEQDADLFFISPISDQFLSEGGGAKFEVHVQPPAGASYDLTLPAPLGKIVDEFRISRGTAKAYEVKKGQFAQIIDVEGQQCSDFMAMRSSALDAGVERHIDSTVSRTMTRSAYPLPGLHDKFFDQDIRPLLAVRQDTVGRHDTFALACTARGYEERGFPGHVNCSDNISEAFAPYGIQARRAWPAINFFFNSWIDWRDHAIASDEAWSRPGDYVAMQALTDLVCVSTACPDDVDPINGWNPTDIHVRIYEETSSISHSVAWRANPKDAAQMTEHSAFYPKSSKLTSTYQVARELWMPAQYDATGATEEYWACKQAATLQDMSGLRKFDIVGPDALELLQHCMTRDVAKLSVHRGFYALMC